MRHDNAPVRHMDEIATHVLASLVAADNIRSLFHAHVVLLHI